MCKFHGFIRQLKPAYSAKLVQLEVDTSLANWPFHLHGGLVTRLSGQVSHIHRFPLVLLYKAYLTDRRQCVSMDGYFSGWLPVSLGVPQGSILGPLFFILNINDSSTLLSLSQPFLYANDTKCYKQMLLLSGSSLPQTDLDSLLHWR